MKKAAIIYLLVSAFCILFNYVYTRFSYGVYSNYMGLMFLFPLLGGFLPAVLLDITKKGGFVSRVSFNLWNSGIAVFIFGCLVRGIINISGRFTEYDTYYWIAGGILSAAAVVAAGAGKKDLCYNTKDTPDRNE